jgi:hypothetical protein
VKIFIGILFLLAALVGAWFFIAWNWSYSSGERAGWVQKFSHKGWVCKTWEGELALVSMPGGAQEKFYFTTHSDEVAAQINKVMGKRVSLHYEEKVGLPGSCFGETRHFVTKVTPTEEIPLGPGVVVPTPAVPAAPPAVAAPAPAPAPAASATR